VRRAVEAALGAAVLEAQTQKGGFSTGAAARLRLSNCSAAFVKALGVDLDQESVGLYRSEAATMPHLPAALPVPRLLDVYDDGEWIALVYGEIRGRQPAVPWQSDELERVAGALDDLSAALRPSPWPDAPGFAEANSNVLRVWRELAAAPPPDLDPWLRRQLERLGAQEIDMAEFVQGDGLLHTDIRSDNLLFTSEGRVVFLDWAWTCNGAPWLDLALFAMTVNAEGGADAEQLVRGHPLTREITPSWIDAVLLAVAGNYWWVARRSNSARPGTRAFQHAYADATLGWLRRRVAG
jgi:Ser/Thr protein kinase RdoA (MazF antagonist)